MTEDRRVPGTDGFDLPDTVFRRCVEDSSDAIMLTGLDGRLRYVNRSWSQLYGYGPEEAVGQRASLLHSGRHDRAFYERMWDDILAPEKGSWSGELVNRARDGSLKTVLLTITPITDGSGSLQPAGFMGLAVDQTAVKDLKEALLHQDKLALLGTLASALAHEIGTPLGVIRGRDELVLEMLSSGGQRHSERAARSVSSILEQVDRVTKVMERLLGFARHPSAGAGDDQCVVEARKSLQALFDDVGAIVEAHFRQAGVELELATPVEGLTTTSGAGIEQILMNLLINAVRAISHASSAVEKPQRSPLGARRVRVALGVIPRCGDEQLSPTAPHWILAVEDSGPGVPEALRQRIFEPFFTTDPLHGTGLGLAISSKIAHDLGGHLVLCTSTQVQDSGAGQPLGGARFELILPAAVIRDQVSDVMLTLPRSGIVAEPSPVTKPYSRSLR